MQAKQNKPCLALMGEFSAGKSTLANLLIGTSPLPTRIIATQLPPVRISYGTNAPFCVDLEGHQTLIDMNALDDMDINATMYIQIFSTEEFLTHCDLIDMPGISDPNMSSDVWERMINQAHGVIWCSHAVQAWRQSEAAVWADMPQSYYAKSLLLLTQIDKVNSPADRARIIKRVSRETDGLFRAVLPISLLSALEEQDDYESWQQSGAGDLVHHLITLLGELNEGQSDVGTHTIPALQAPKVENESVPAAQDPIAPRRIRAATRGRI